MCPAPTAGNGDETLLRRQRIPRLHKYAWFIGIGVLAVVTIVAFREFALDDWHKVVDYWSGKTAVLPWIIGIAILDLALEGGAWAWVCTRFGLRISGWNGFRVFMAGNAGRVMPAQLGRLIRPEALVRLRRGPVGDCFKAEGAVFVLDVIAVFALLAGLAAWRVHPALLPPTIVVIVTISLFLGARIAERLSDTRLELPKDFWWHWTSFAIVGVQMAGWVAHGFAFYVLIVDLPGTMGLWDALFYAPASAVVGSASGLPGGVGATEGALGVGMRINGVPAAHLIVVVAALRLVTFWSWVLLGWFFLIGMRKKKRLPAAPPAVAPASVSEP